MSPEFIQILKIKWIMPTVIAPFPVFPQQPPNGEAKLNCQIQFFTSQFLSIKYIFLLQKGQFIFYSMEGKIQQTPLSNVLTALIPSCTCWYWGSWSGASAGSSKPRRSVKKISQWWKWKQSDMCIFFKQTTNGQWGEYRLSKEYKTKKHSFPGLFMWEEITHSQYL